MTISGNYDFVIKLIIVENAIVIKIIFGVMLFRGALFRTTIFRALKHSSTPFTPFT